MSLVLCQLELRASMTTLKPFSLTSSLGREQGGGGGGGRDRGGGGGGGRDGGGGGGGGGGGRD